MKRMHPRRYVTALLAAGLLVGAMVPAVSAAPPRWDLAVTQLVKGGVSDGSTQGFDIKITNKGPSNISSLYLFAQGGEEPVYIDSPRSGCSAVGDPFFCTFGAVTKGQSFTVRVAFNVTGDANDEYKIGFEINTTGIVDGDNNSHGDSLVSNQVVAVIPGTDGDKAGKWTLDANDNLKNSQAISASNKQATKLNGLQQYVPASVSDGVGVSFNCPKAQCKAKPFGQWSSVSVNFGTPAATPFEITITVAASELPNNPNLSKLVVYHVLDNGNVETISELCGAGAVPAKGCRVPTYATDGSGNLEILIKTWYNGGYKGAF
jgi:hypothetical protein